MSPEFAKPGARTDRWDLAGGGTRYAPVHPLHLAVPGFWDEVVIGGREFSKLLCVSFVMETELTIDEGRLTNADEVSSSDNRQSAIGNRQLPPLTSQGNIEEGRAGATPTSLIELFPYLSYWHWYEDRIEARYYLVVREGIGFKQQAGVRVFLEEKRYIAGDGSLHCELSFDLLKQHPPRLQVVAWGVDTQLSVVETQAHRTGAAAVEPVVVPRLEHTPFMEMLRADGLWHAEGAGQHRLSAVQWDVELAADTPVVLHVAARPA